MFLVRIYCIHQVFWIWLSVFTAVLFDCSGNKFCHIWFLVLDNCCSFFFLSTCAFERPRNTWYCLEIHYLLIQKALDFETKKHKKFVVKNLQVQNNKNKKQTETAYTLEWSKYVVVLAIQSETNQSNHACTKLVNKQKSFWQSF